MIRWGEADSPFGRMTLAEGPLGICRIGFGDGVVDELARDWPLATLQRDPSRAARLAVAVIGRGGVEVCVKGSAFQLAIWREVRRIPAGTTISYGELAHRVGRPSAARAVGAAVGANRIAWLIPCHRVVRSDGGLGGFRWGLDCKRAMLEFEWSGAWKASPSLLEPGHDVA
jgi:AraC family transcriptional regulator of adaptative response/methylated-DNA-[protein]-cysteine methyltransferase